MKVQRIGYTPGEAKALLGSFVDIEPEHLAGYIIIGLSDIPGIPPSVSTDTNDPMQIISALAYCILAIGQRVTGADPMYNEGGQSDVVG